MGDDLDEWVWVVSEGERRRGGAHPAERGRREARCCRPTGGDGLWPKRNEGSGERASLRGKEVEGAREREGLGRTRRWTGRKIGPEGGR